MHRKYARLAAACGLAFTAAASAYARPDIYFGAGQRTAIAVPHDAASSTPYLIRKSKTATIYSNLASAYPKGLYFSSYGSTVASTQYVAAGFTPKATATAVEIEAAVGNFGDGKDSYVLSIYSDSSGVPGTALTSAVVTAATPFGACCGLIVSKIKGGLTLTAKTSYWVVVSLNKKQSAAGNDGAWSFATVNQVDQHPFAFNPNGSGWMSAPSILVPAFGVFSQ